MRWRPGGISGDIEDRRGFRLGGRGLGVGGFLILLILSIIFRRDFFSLVGGGSDAPPGAATEITTSPEEESRVKFMSFVLDSAQSFWNRTFEAQGLQYRRAKLVLFRDVVQSACGMAQSASGPFYCPGDEKVYLDLAFFNDLDTRFGAPGDFAQAYVVAHEIGHHVQTLLGLDRQVRESQQSSPGAANQLQVKMELQADCLAGVWAYSTKELQLLEAGDIEEGLGAAAAVGDDRIQRSTQGYVNPDAFTHGSSAQRSEWFRRGFESGKVDDCNTFGK